jgi:hypothetical protein
MQNIALGRLLAAAGAVTLVMIDQPARANVVFSSFTEETFTVASTTGSNNAFCSGNTCDFLGGAGGNAPGSVNAPLLSSTTNAAGLPVVATGSPTIIGQTSAHALEWWSPGTYGTTKVTAGTTSSLSNPNITSGTTQLFSNTSFFPPGGNDHSSFLTAEFTGNVTVGAGNTLSFTGSVDDNVIIYYRTGTTGAYTLLTITPDFLSNQAAFDFTSAALGAGTYEFEVFYADRSSTQASLVLDADVTAAVPEPSTWVMMILGFLGLGFMGYRHRSTIALKGV